MINQPNMENLSTLVDEITSKLDHLDLLREEVLKLARKLNRLSGRGIGKIIKGQECTSNLLDTRSIIVKISEIMSTLAPALSWKITNTGIEEYIEFEILNAIISKVSIPGPQDLNVPYWMWLTGLGDVPGELRRIILNKFINGEIEETRPLLQSLQEIYLQMSGLDYSKSLIPNLRRKVDVARAVTERTESDFAHAIISNNIRNTH